MRLKLFPFQERALISLHEKIKKAHILLSDNDPQVISLVAPTGSGKTIIITKLLEDIVFGYNSVADPTAIFIWISDIPELNEQTRHKIESKSDKFNLRNIKIIDSNFDEEYFSRGSINFLNTQKLGSDRKLTQKSDTRHFTIWETLKNTILRQPTSIYVIIDEAHRGMYESPSAEKKAQSIVQKFLKGSKEDNLPIMPLVIGVTATPQRFQKLIEGTQSTIQKVIINTQEVMESGLLKDRIIIHFPDSNIGAEMTMFVQAVANWKKKCELWEQYCRREKTTKQVSPILVVQVEDGNERRITLTDIKACINIIAGSLGIKLCTGEVVHTFEKRESLMIGDLEIHYIETSRIEDDQRVKVVFFKMNLSTGWDCPRAETMMSFRHAIDHTYIAQLLGRMIRSPLGMRIETDTELNDVSLYLPFFEGKTVKMVEKSLREGETVVPAETGSYKELITLKRNRRFEHILTGMSLVTYRVDALRKKPALQRLIALARALAQDAIDLDIRKKVLKEVLNEIDNEIFRLKNKGVFDDLSKAITEIAMRTLIIDHNRFIVDSKKETKGIIELSELDINKLFEIAGKKLGEGLHREYWVRHLNRDALEIKTEIIVLAESNESMTKLESFADKLFYELYDASNRAFAKLSAERKSLYTKLALSSPIPMPLDWTLPEMIDFRAGEKPQDFDNHLFVPIDESCFKATLNEWESGLIIEETKRNDFVAWLRNLDRKSWSLSIPYYQDGVISSMFPDFIIVRIIDNKHVFDILEIHDPTRTDNYLKAIGLAKFAEKHANSFGRIQLIRKSKGPDKKEHFYRLDMIKLNVRNIVRGISSNEELDRIIIREAFADF
jgi:type III restriction enzyme